MLLTIFSLLFSHFFSALFSFPSSVFCITHPFTPGRRNATTRLLDLHFPHPLSVTSGSRKDFPLEISCVYFPLPAAATISLRPVYFPPSWLLRRTVSLLVVASMMLGFFRRMSAWLQNASRDSTTSLSSLFQGSKWRFFSFIFMWSLLCSCYSSLQSNTSLQHCLEEAAPLLCLHGTRRRAQRASNGEESGKLSSWRISFLVEFPLKEPFPVLPLPWSSPCNGANTKDIVGIRTVVPSCSGCMDLPCSKHWHKPVIGLKPLIFLLGFVKFDTSYVTETEQASRNTHRIMRHSVWVTLLRQYHHWHVRPLIL